MKLVTFCLTLLFLIQNAPACPDLSGQWVCHIDSSYVNEYHPNRAWDRKFIIDYQGEGVYEFTVSAFQLYFANSPRTELQISPTHTIVANGNPTPEAINASWSCPSSNSLLSTASLARGARTAHTRTLVDEDTFIFKFHQAFGPPEGSAPQIPALNAKYICKKDYSDNFQDDLISI